jgi:hypothetical protein
MNHRHDLRLTHSRQSQTFVFGVTNADSEIDISTNSDDLTEAFRELLSRMPTDLYQALKDAMSGAIVQRDLDTLRIESSQ